MHQRTLRFPAGVALAGEKELTLAAEIFWPAPEAIAAQPVLLFCLPGGAMNRHYYDLRLGDNASFSFAEAMTAQGFIVASLDHPGVGESTRPADGFALTPEVLAEAAANAASHIVDGLRKGTLAPELAALPGLVSIGVGHSMGAKITATQHARRPSHAGLALLGFSNRGLIEFLPEPAKALIDNPAKMRAEIAAVTREIYKQPYMPMPASPEAKQMFQGAKADKEGVEALKRARDTLLLTAGTQSMIPRSASEELAAIRVPVFIGIGDSDIAGPTHEIPASLPNCPDITFLELENAGHAHFIFASRTKLFSRVGAWARMIAEETVKS